MCFPNPMGGTLANSHQVRLKIARCICASIEPHLLQVFAPALINRTPSGAAANASVALGKNLWVPLIAAVRQRCRRAVDRVLTDVHMEQMVVEIVIAAQP